MKDMSTWVGRRIKLAREQLGLHQSELAERLDRSQTAISYWESGKRAPGLSELLDLAEALGQDVSYFIPPRRTLPSIRTVLRATVGQLEQEEFDLILQELIEEAECKPLPKRELRVTFDRPARAAQELLAQESVVRPPVNVERIAHRCGIRVVRRRFEDWLSGLLISLDEGALVGVNEAQPPHRQRFTIAHELGHYVLGHHDRLHVDLGPDTQHGNPPEYDWRSERAANEFAAMLLMPPGMMHDAQEKGLSTAELARRFGVSQLAMGYRLVDLGYR